MAEEISALLSSPASAWQEFTHNKVNPDDLNCEQADFAAISWNPGRQINKQKARMRRNLSGRKCLIQKACYCFCASSQKSGGGA